MIINQWWLKLISSILNNWFTQLLITSLYKDDGFVFCFLIHSFIHLPNELDTHTHRQKIHLELLAVFDFQIAYGVFFSTTNEWMNEWIDQKMLVVWNVDGTETNEMDKQLFFWLVCCMMKATITMKKKENRFFSLVKTLLFDDMETQNTGCYSRCLFI